ncbi:hypothetical protein [Streptomyces sp. NPDC001480]|uniref:hypothetical protein n=1 Tax=Streptomyces sp. NPDC001480 TaxID=3364577 RepID=UPI0036BE7877
MPNSTADRPVLSFARRSGVLAAGVAALVGITAASTPGTAHAEPTATTVSAADFSDCPPLPSGVDPTRWRCEVHNASPKLTMGKLTVDLAPITMTHAEGPLPDGTDGQVWGAMHTTPTAVSKGLAIQPEYGGRSDFYTGRFSLRFRLLSPLLRHGCTIGADAPVDFRMKRSGPSEWLSQDPPVIRFSAYDDTFTAPAAEHCGPLTASLNRGFGLPAASGNLMTYDAVYTFKTYDQLPER